MKALVLAGGTGSRLRPFTHTRAKQLLPIANRPVVHYALQAIADAGIEEAGVVVGSHADEIRQAVGDGSAFGLRLTYLHQAEPLGLAHAVLIARDFLADDDFLLYLGDNYLEDGVTGFVRRAEAGRDAARLLLTPVPDPTAFGVAEVGGDGLVRRLEEKPDRPRSDLALIGVYAFTPAVHEAVRAIRPSGRGSWRSPTRCSGWSTTASPYERRRPPGPGATPAAWTTCWRPTGTSWTGWRAASTARSTRTACWSAGSG